MQYPVPLRKLIELLKGLPGVGSKSADRFAFDLLHWPCDRLEALGEALGKLKERLRFCSICGCLLEEESCPFCSKKERDRTTVCILASPRDVFAIEQTRSFKGIYHVLGGLLSPLDGKLSHHLTIDRLKERIPQEQIQEVIVALDSTLEGDATALYLKRELATLSVRVSRLAFGLPMGSSLEYVDGGTLSRALTGRNQF